MNKSINTCINTFFFFLLFFKTDFVCVCLLVQCPEATLTQFQCLRQTDRQTHREDSAQLASSEFSLLYYIFKYIYMNNYIHKYLFFFFLLFFKLILCVFACYFSVQKPRLRSSSACDRQTDRQTHREGRARCRPSTRARGHVEGTLGFLFNSYKSFAFYDILPWRGTPPSFRYVWKLCFGGASPVCLKSSLFPVLLSVPLACSAVRGGGSPRHGDELQQGLFEMWGGCSNIFKCTPADCILHIPAWPWQRLWGALAACLKVGGAPTVPVLPLARKASASSVLYNSYLPGRGDTMI